MKKFIVGVVILLFNVSAYAQLNVSSVVEKKPETVLTLYPAYSWLYKTSCGYKFCAVTDNRFDECLTTVYLGETPEQAIQTLSDLKGLMDNKIALVTAKQPSGDLSIRYAAQLGAKMLWIKQEGNAGKSWISYNQVERLLKYFNQ